jgi:tetratricopeptide (TPR) repeat protein
VLRGKPATEDLLYNRGMVHLAWADHLQKIGKEAEDSWQKAIADFTQVLELNSQHGKAQFSRGEANVVWGAFLQGKPGALSKLQSALSDLNRAIELDPSNAEAYWRRGDATLALSAARYSGEKIGLQDIRSALADYEETIRRRPDLKPKLSSKMEACHKLVDCPVHQKQ